MYSDNRNEKLYMIERLVSAFTYPTMGTVGFVWILLGLVFKSNPKAFTLYHIYQSIFISISLVVISLLLSIILNILGHIPFLSRLIAQVVFWFNAPIFFGWSLIQCFINFVIAYLSIFALFGKYSYLPKISEIIKGILKL